MSDELPKPRIEDAWVPSEIERMRQEIEQLRKERDEARAIAEEYCGIPPGLSDSLPWERPEVQNNGRGRVNE